MAVSIRLRRMGRKKQPHYRVVVADSRRARDGRFVESLGYYRPLTDPARLVLDLERVDYWIGNGAIPSDTVRSLIKRARTGGDDRIAVGEVDLEAEKARKAEELAARRKAEVAATKDSGKAEKPKGKAKAEPKEEAPEAEAAAAEEAPEAEAAATEDTPDPEAAAEEAPAAEAATEAPEAEAAVEAPPAEEKADEKKAAEAEAEEEKGK
jgi:small subunit ribosomal protein S16